MTTNDLQPYIGRTVLVPEGDYNVECKVIDTRELWGRVDLCVSPVTGNGHKWIAASRVKEVGK
jgi:hypothetical protein